MTEKKKVKMGVSALLIVAITFLGIGLVFMPVGIAVYLHNREEMANAIIFLGVFGGLGILFFVLGIIFLLIIISKKRRCTELVRKGNYIRAEICEVHCNYNVQINRRYAYVVKCKYQDALGRVHFFKSRNLMFNPETLLKDRIVKVYVDGENFKNYYMDIDELLPEVYEH